MQNNIHIFIDLFLFIILIPMVQAFRTNAVLHPCLLFSDFSSLSHKSDVQFWSSNTTILHVPDVSLLSHLIWMNEWQAFAELKDLMKSRETCRLVVLRDLG